MHQNTKDDDVAARTNEAAVWPWKSEPDCYPFVFEASARAAATSDSKH